MRILLCIRDSVYSESAIKCGGLLAHNLNSDITVMTVMKAISSIYQSRISKTHEKLQEWGLDLPQTLVLKQARKILKDIGLDVEAKTTGEMVLHETDSGVHELKAGGSHGKLVTLKVRHGKPTEEIIEEAEEGNYDLIVVGRTQKKGVEKTVFGSVATDITAYSKIPVLSVKKQVPIKKILTCTDGSKDAENAEIFSGYLAKNLKANLTLLSVIPTIKRTINPPEDVAKSVSEDALDSGKKKIKKYFNLNVNTILKNGHAVDQIIEESKGYDLIVLGSRGLSKIERMLVGHVSLNVEKLATSNVLVVRSCNLCEIIKNQL